MLYSVVAQSLQGSLFIFFLTLIGMAAWLPLRALQLKPHFFEAVAWGLFLCCGVAWYLPTTLQLLSKGFATSPSSGFSIAALASVALAFFLGLWFFQKYRTASPTHWLIAPSLFFLTMLVLGVITVVPYWSSFLPIPTRGNLDIYNYINKARVLAAPIETSFVGLIGADYTSAIKNLEWNSLDATYQDALTSVKWDSFGSFVLLAITSLLNRFNSAQSLEVYQITGATISAVAGLIVSTVYSLVKKTMKVQIIPSAIIAIQFLLSPLFLYVILNFFLAQLLATWALLGACLLLLTTINATDHQTPRWSLFVRLLPFIGIMFFCYPASLFLNLMLLGGLSTISSFYWTPSLTFKTNIAALLKRVGPFWLMLLAAFFSVLVVFPERFKFLLQMLFFINKSTNGWTLDYISPISLLGFNADTRIHFINNPIFIILAIAVFLFFLVRTLWRLRPAAQAADDEQNSSFTLFLIYSLSWLAYNAMAFIAGPKSYFQWKFATMYPMVFAFAPAVFLLKWLHHRLEHQKTLSRWVATGFVALALVTLFYQGESLTAKISKNFLDLRQLELLAPFDQIVVDQLESHEAMLLPSIIRNKRLLFTSPSFYPMLNSNDLDKLNSSAVFLTKRTRDFSPADLVAQVSPDYVILKNPRSYLAPRSKEVTPEAEK